MTTQTQITEYQLDDRNSTTTSSGVSLLAILPLLTNFAISSPPDTKLKGLEIGSKSVYSESLGEYPSKYLSEINGTDTDLSYSIVSTSEIHELQIIENFVSGLLQDSEQQPGELNNYMYENIDDLLIVD